MTRKSDKRWRSKRKKEGRSTPEDFADATADEVGGVHRDAHDPGADPKSNLKIRQTVKLLEAVMPGADVAVNDALRRVVQILQGADRFTVLLAKSLCLAAAKKAKLERAAQIIDGLFAPFAAREESATSKLGAILSDPEPAADPVDAEVFEEILGILAQYLVLPAGAPVLIALWISLTYLLESPGLDIAPILAITSPVKRCGKSRLIEVLNALVPRALMTVNISPAALFRSIEKYKPTLLIDEADSFLKQKGDELRGVLNSGHTRAGFVMRAEGDDLEPTPFATFGFKAIAAIGSLPTTIEDRSVIIPLKRKTRTEKVSPLRVGRIVSDLEPVRRRLARWARDHEPAFAKADPELPALLNDRARDNCRPLLQAATATGGDWIERATQAIDQIYGAIKPAAEAGILLLEDVRALLTEPETRTAVVAHNQRGEAVCVLPTALHQALVALEERPWPTWSKGRPISLNRVGALLGDFDIRSRRFWDGSTGRRGYAVSALEQTFDRYLSAESTPSDASGVSGDNESEGFE
jgi:putative DNA primase/helicase